MKHLPCIIITLISLTVNGQASLFGEYNQSTTLSEGLENPRSLKLNCDMSFLAKDSYFILYGKWKFKNETLILSIDSISNYKSIKVVNSKVTYIIKNNGIFRKSVHRKEFNDLIKSDNKRFRGVSSESFEKFKLREESKYFEKLKSYDCK